MAEKRDTTTKTNGITGGEERPAGVSKFAPINKLTAEVQERVCELITQGDHPHVAAGASGVTPRTFLTWMQRGKADGERMERGEGSETIYSQFFVAVTLASHKAESDMREMVRRGDDRGVSFGRSRATLELMKRRFPQRWADRIVKEIQESNRLVIDVVQRVCSEENSPQIFIRICEELARLDSEDEAEGIGDNVGGLH
jgi:hypothetical protein